MAGIQVQQTLVEISRKLELALRKMGGDSGPADAFELDFSSGGETIGPPDAKGLERQRALVKALSGIACCEDVDQLLERIMDAMIAVSGAERGFLMTVEENRKIEFKVGRAMGERTGSDVETSRSIITQVLRSREPVHIADTSKLDELSTSIQGLQLRSIICVPLMTGSRTEDPCLSGVVYLDSRAVVQALDADDFELVLGLAAQAALALDYLEVTEHAQVLEEDAEHHKENLSKLLEVARMISSTLDIDELLNIIVDKALEVSKADRGYIMLFEGGELKFKIGRNWNKKLGAAKKSMALTEAQFFFSRSITGKAVDTKKSVCLTDALGDGGMDASVSIVQMELQSVMCTPFLDGEKVTGLVYVDSKARNREFDEADLELFEGLAGQASIALKNAFLYNQVGEKERMAGELDIASRMQQDLLPEVVPTIEGIELAGFMAPAKEVGGDYYDFLECVRAPGAALDIVVGDVSGKGLGAGIVAVMARCHLRSMLTAYGGQSPHNILSYLNTVLSGELKPGQFMTMLLLHYEVEGRRLTYASAGHEHIILWHKSTQTTTTIRSGGTALGLTASARPTEDIDLPLQIGDLAVLYTDGVTEAMNDEQEEWEMERFLDVILRHAPRDTPEKIVQVINEELSQFVGSAPQSDDITIVVIRRTS